MQGEPGTLWVVATPLGNAGDLTPRARDILGRAGLLLCEDTRRAIRLLADQGIAQPPEGRRMLSLFDHNEEGRIPQVLAHLDQGGEAALVSDAGTPVLSDPGYLLVRACLEAGHRVRPAPGPSAVMAALCVSGLAPQPFVFLGFLPRKSGDVRQALARFAPTGCTLVFFERKDRLAKTLALALEVLGERDCVVARELTKTHEEFLRSRLSEMAAQERELLGEITVVLGPALEQATADPDMVRRVLEEEARAGGRPREVARRAAARLPGRTAKELYALLGQGRGGEHVT
ncbi:Ribosomal RNA small subunit methyltransferase I [Fundidesulfovibrio magnetotacticus]|uniref:Ribosomal RNA small subunit methyltransferase I n=1 Tax=Fundidesulfovibrio magnetotacticus TaxID=2730080 RepID=A0A6V8M366_9BACT|nr:16S rRNA (cytidine(1402)-2'-O)-methyltransferase [Fundidesulfovibrio magnetotacticus]GFK94895.1 Ribosomal RNA small subunit methyltransferase I [Fundidesulfovibrio magnetotacticus]